MRVGWRWSAWGLFLAAACTLAGSAAFILNASYLETQERIHAQALASAHVVAAHVEALLGASRQASHQTDKVLGAAVADVTPTKAEEIRQIVQDMPLPVVGWVIDAEGRPVFSTAPQPPTPSVADRPYFEELKTGPGPMVISSLIVGRRSGDNVFLVAQRLQRDGQFAGAVIMTFQASVLSQFRKTLDLGEGSTVSVFRLDGQLVARYPPPDGPLNLANYVLFTEFLPARSEGAYDAVSPADGVKRVVGFRKLDNAPLVALASIAVGHHWASFWNQVRWLAAILTLLLAALGALMVALIRLMTREEQNQKALALALERNTLLLQEVHHRVKNNLQAVAGMLQLAPLDAAAKQAMSLRLSAMSAIHELAYRSDQYADVELAPYLSRLIANLRAAFGTAIEITTDFEPVVVDRDQALPLGLLTNEVLFNAFKHAFPDGRHGRIQVSLKRATEGGGVDLVIHDNGVGYQPPAASSGIGARLIKGLVAQIGGDMHLGNEGGTLFRLRFDPRKHGG